MLWLKPISLQNCLIYFSDLQFLYFKLVFVYLCVWCACAYMYVFNKYFCVHKKLWTSCILRNKADHDGPTTAQLYSNFLNSSPLQFKIYYAYTKYLLYTWSTCAAFKRTQRRTLTYIKCVHCRIDCSSIFLSRLRTSFYAHTSFHAFSLSLLFLFFLSLHLYNIRTYRCVWVNIFCIGLREQYHDPIFYYD